MVMRQSGIGLLEMLIVVAILGIIATVAFPASAALTHQSRINEFDSQVKRAVGLARAEALKNPIGAQGDQPVAEVTLSGGTISVARCNDTGCSSSTSIWSGDLPDDIAIEVGSTALTHLRLNSFGQLINAPTSLSYNLKRGSYDDALSPRTLR